MRKFRFQVEGELPPKKGGALSMWGTATEAPRLIALREAALGKLGSGRPFSQNIRLTLRVHVGRPKASVNPGDLDSFVAGVCDGLMAADRRAKIHSLFSQPRNADVHPHKTIAIWDDQHVVEINATKCEGPGNRPWYEVTLEGE